VGWGRRWLTASVELDGDRYQSAIGVWPGTGTGSGGSSSPCGEASRALASSDKASGLSRSMPRPNRRDDDSMGVSSTGGKVTQLPCGAVTADTGVDSDESEAALGGCR
jgi:hypothetical protein